MFYYGDECFICYNVKKIKWNLFFLNLDIINIIRLIDFEVFLEVDINSIKGIRLIVF